MSLSELLEDFSAVASGRMLEMSDVLLEEEKLTAFEKGYQAGWDDSNSARNEEHVSNSSELLDALQDMSRRLGESQIDVLRQMKPLLGSLVKTLLPVIARKTLAPKIAEILYDLLETHGHQPIQIFCAAHHLEDLQTSLMVHSNVPISISEDPQLVAGQVRINLGTVEERELDFKSVIDGIGEVIESFFEANAVEVKAKDVA
ncbi:flagellar biosynthesis protein [Roseovarius phycicola]|uniref:Flagellar biosynthesis protein n=1 Tax=Roseovarius phycicola TaxID=3080976 RepID=A0ABZ2HHP6_9RHOB